MTTPTPSPEPILSLTDVQFRWPKQTAFVVDVPAFTVAPGDRIALTGESGSGKTTLLHLMAGLLRPSAGSVRLAGEELATLSEARRDRLRAQAIGYLFQTFNLLQPMSAWDNVTLATRLTGRTDRAAARALLERLGLGERLHHRPAQLSVGQQSRVALARALVNRPRLLLADEPTGNLDPTAAGQVMDVLLELAAEAGTAVIVVTHDDRVAARLDRQVPLSEINRAAVGAGTSAGPMDRAAETEPGA